MASPLSSSRAQNKHGIQFDDDVDCIVKHDIRITHNFGEDGYSSVLRGTLSGRRVAIKRIQVTKGTDQPTDEFKVLQQLNHPNVVKILHCEHDNNFMYYAFERCDASLDQLFLKSDDPKKYKGPMPHHVDALLQLASGLEHIHSHNLVHGDIKPENVLISVGSAGQDEIILKWANIGLTRNVSERGRGSINQTGGNNAWLAPELLLSLKLNSNVEENNCKANAKSDVYAQGLVFGSLFLNGEHLYGSMEHENEIPQNITEGNPINMQKIDGKLRVCYENDLLKKILERDPDKRMTSRQVVHQLKDTKNKITGKEKELLELCGRDSRSDLTEKIKNLIQFGINLNAKDDGGRNALHRLCRFNSNSNLIDAIRLLIQLGIDVNAKDDDGWNALHHLCCNNSNSNLIDAIRLLIQLGIDVNAKDDDGRNALHHLCRFNSKTNLIDVIQLFIDKGIDVNAKDNDGWNALHYLCLNDSNSNLIDAIRLLIQRGIDVNAKDDDGQHALHYLCRNISNSNLIDAIRLLIQLGIDVNAKDDDGRNALHHLCRFNSKTNLIDAIQLLIQEGIDVNEKDNSRRNALHDLCENHSNSNLIDAIRLLIQRGIPVVSDGHDARLILRWNYKIENKDEILKLLDEAAPV
ncbi:hypothetical protein GHT06_014521 [Daphnia sinensis]|uniref:Protein kinase domain-containing protein n=1 Tax=Daphnia sinensis TaxID=1820382 RepID=A0AAD5PU02_9CRUS|nr:hypothetical protein GHT06_014521 [Daphnia sinensis]